MTNSRDKLEAGEKSGREDAGKVYDDSGLLVCILVVIETLAGARVGIVLGTEHAVVVQIVESCQDKTHQSARKNKPEDEVVTLGETDWVIDFSSSPDEPVRWRSIGFNHGW